MYEMLYTDIVEKKVDISVCDIKCFKKEKTKMSKETSKKSKQFKQKEIYEIIFSKNFFHWGPCNKLYKFSKISKIRFLEGRIYEDVAYNLNVFANIVSISYIPKKMYYYRVNNLSTTRQNVSIKRLDSVYNTLDSYKLLPLKYQCLFLQSIDYIIYNLILDIVKEKKVYSKLKIFYEIKKIYKKNKKIMKPLKNKNFKEYCLFSVIRINPLLFGIYKRLILIIKGDEN